MWESFTWHDLQINENLTLMKPSNTVSDSLSFMMKVTFFMSRGKWKVAHQYYPELLSCHFAGQHIGNVLGSTAYNAEAMGGQYTRRWCTGNVRCGVEYWVMGDGQWGTPITMSWDANTAPQYWCQCWSNSDPQYWCQYWCCFTMHWQYFIRYATFLHTIQHGPGQQNSMM